MSDKISANITYVDTDNNKGSKAITDISPTADNGAIKNFCVGLLGLTTNTLSQIDRVEKTDITNATAKPKLTLDVKEDEISTLKLNPGTYVRPTIADLPATVKANLPKLYCSYTCIDGDLEIDLTNSFGFGIAYMWMPGDEPVTGMLNILLKDCINSSTGLLTVDFVFTETPVTQETTYRLTVTMTAGEATFVQL